MTTVSESPVFEAPADETLDLTTETPDVEIVVKGRNVEVPDHFRIYVSEKLSRLQRFDPSIHLYDVELYHERNRRQRKSCQHVEITVRRKGPVVRAEAAADSFYAALEAVCAKLESRLRRAKDRRQVHYGGKKLISVARATASLALDGQEEPAEFAATKSTKKREPQPEGPGRVVRVKAHPDTPMTVDEALSAMELVGHDFFLFHDKETDRPSVVYRRHAFDYGLIRLV